MTWQLISWPVGLYMGRKPGISSAYRTLDRPDHFGVDIAYRRISSDINFEVGTPYGTKNWVAPPGVLNLSAHKGTVIDVGVKSRGTWVKVQDDEYPEYVTVYRHLMSANVTVGSKVVPGTMLGPMGNDPSQGPNAFRHLHFEILHNGEYTDPEPWLRGAKDGNPLRYFC